MKHKITLFIIAATMQNHPLYALSLETNICRTTTCTGTEIHTTNPCPIGADSSQCYKASDGKTYNISNCTSCGSGEELRSINVHSIIPNNACNSTNTVNWCCKPCNNNTCTNDTTYSTSGTDGYEHLAKRTCDDCINGCKIYSYDYRCAAGYYGKTINGTTGCQRCPQFNRVYGTSIAGNNDIITKCYMPANTSMWDNTGTYIYTADCYYDDVVDKL